MHPRTRWIVLVLALPAGLLLAEALVRALDLGSYPRPEVKGAVFGPSPEPRLGFENIPGGVQRIVYRARSGAVLREVVSEVNAQGFRGRAVAEEKAAGTFRIACLGDSHTFGYGVGEGESWPCVLERTLRARDDGERFEILNCGVNAYDAEQSLALLELRVERFRPDLVLLGFFVNDTALRGVPPPPEEEPPSWILRLVDPRHAGFVGWLRRRSKFVDLVADGVFNRASAGYFARSRSALFGDRFEGWIRVQAALERTARRLETEDVRFAVLLIPLMVEQDGRTGSARALEKVQAYCVSRSIACIDLEPPFRGLDLARMRVHPGDFHADAEAHRILGEEAARALASAGMLSRREAPR